MGASSLISQTSLLEVLISVIGGGTIVPLAYKIWSRYHTKEQDADKARAEIEAISTHAATEAVEVMQGAMGILRRQVKDGHVEILALRKEREEDRDEIRRLRQQVNQLIIRLRELGASVEGLEAAT